MRKILLFMTGLITASIFSSCTKSVITSNYRVADQSAKATGGVTTYLTGSPADANTPVLGGLVLMGGSTDVDEAIRWMLQRSGGGDVVVIRSSGADGYNQYMYDMVPVNSVETIIIDSRTKAADASVAQKIRNAEALFIAGGDQWNYVNFWKNTPVEDAINYCYNTKRITIGGTSAGLAILGSAYYSAATGGSVTTTQALADPYHRYLTLGSNDFISIPLLANTITDSHYSQRDRQGRHITFMARLMKDFGYTAVKGIGVDEQTAVCIDENGTGKVYGYNSAYFLRNTTLGAETCVSRTPLTWSRSAMAISAYKINASLSGAGSFDANTWALSGGTAYHYYVNNGVLSSN